MAVKSREELYEIYMAAVQGQDAEGVKLTSWHEGSLNDMIANAVCMIGSELQSTIVEEFNRTFLSNTEGEEKDELATDHFGSSFERPAAVKASGIIKFTRPNASYGVCVIPAATVVEALANANNETPQYETTIEVTLGASDTFVYAPIEALEAGPGGNRDAGLITTLIATLDDSSIECTNEAATTGGYDELNDSEYQDWIGENISASRGGSAPAIEAALLLVDGIEAAKAHETFMRVSQVNIANQTQLIGSPFSIVVAKTYIADANGTANSALLAKAEAAISEQRAYAVNILLVAAQPFSLSWTADVTLNIGGPNYAELSASFDRIAESMRDYIDSLDIGADFDPVTARLAILELWGAGGTNDVTAFTNVLPVGKVSTAENIKLIPGTITIT